MGEAIPRQLRHDQWALVVMAHLLEELDSVVGFEVDSTVAVAEEAFEGDSRNEAVLVVDVVELDTKEVEGLHREAAPMEIVVGMVELLQMLQLVPVVADLVGILVGMEVAVVVMADQDLQIAMVPHQWESQRQLEVGMTHVAAAHMMTEMVAIVEEVEGMVTAVANLAQVAAAIWSR